jgi:ABC-type amino acid transport substrate-binding protein
MRMLLAATALLLSMSQIHAAVLDHVRQSGKFTIGYRADATPYSYRTETGKPAGYIVDLCREVAKSVQKAVGSPVTIAYRVVPADRRFEAVRDHEIDILCDPSTETLARRELVDFSLPTFLDGAGVLTREGKLVHRFEDLTGKHVGVLAGTTTEHLLRSSLAALNLAVKVTVVHDHRDGISLLTSDKIDAYFADRAILRAASRRYNLVGFRIAPEYFSYETYALALPRGDSDFRLLVDRTLAGLYRSGRIGVLLHKTFGDLQSDELLNALFAINSLPDR